MEAKDILKQARKKSGFSQGEVSKKLGYETAQFISNWERGLSLPPPKKVKSLSKILGLSMGIMIDMLEKQEMIRVKNKYKRLRKQHGVK